MPTAVGGRFADGTAVAADRRETRGGQVVSERTRRIHSFDEIVIASAAPAGDLRELSDRFDEKRRRYAHDHGRAPTVDAAERLASDLAAQIGVSALLLARDRAGKAQLVRIDDTGGSTREPMTAIGSGAAVAIGLLEALDRDIPLEDAEHALGDLLNTVAGRDTETGDTVDIGILSDRIE